MKESPKEHEFEFTRKTTTPKEKTTKEKSNKKMKEM